MDIKSKSVEKEMNKGMNIEKIKGKRGIIYYPYPWYVIGKNKYGFRK